MINYDHMILQWRNSVAQYCEQHGIPNMDLKNLRVGDTYDYALYSVCKQIEDAIQVYVKTPSSPFYAEKLVSNIKRWYALTANNKLQKWSYQAVPNAIFARFAGRVK